jgi:hypothetical protein
VGLLHMILLEGEGISEGLMAAITYKLQCCTRQTEVNFRMTRHILHDI